jgi:hypothetical protein
VTKTLDDAKADHAANVEEIRLGLRSLIDPILELQQLAPASPEFELLAKLKAPVGYVPETKTSTDSRAKREGKMKQVAKNGKSASASGNGKQGEDTGSAEE